jgi:AraC-like DNA-binding protein
MADGRDDNGRGATSAAHVFRFSTDDLPQKDRLPHFRESFARGTCKIDFVPLVDTPFHAEVNIAFLPDCSLVLSKALPARYLRTSEMLAFGTDDLILNIGLDGPSSIRQCRREAVASKGDAILATAGDVGDGRQGAQYLALTMPRRRLKALVPGIEDRLIERIPQSTPVLRLLTGHIHNWQHGALATTPQMQQMFSDHLYDLVALLFNARGDAAEQARQRGGRAALRAMVMREIDRSYLDPNLSLPALAQRLGISPRYIQMLLAETDTSFLREVLLRRLERAHTLLQTPAHHQRSVIDIVYDCGFGSAGNFYKLFRRVYGVTPSDVRAQCASHLPITTR